MKNFILTLILLLVLSIPIIAYTDTTVDAYTFFSMGYYYLYDNNIAEAKKMFLESLHLSKSPSATLYSALADVSNILGENGDAKKYALLALKENPNDEISLQILSYIFLLKFFLHS